MGFGTDKEKKNGLGPIQNSRWGKPGTYIGVVQGITENEITQNKEKLVLVEHLSMLWMLVTSVSRHRTSKMSPICKKVDLF